MEQEIAKLDPATVMNALGDPIRWGIVRELAAGKPVAVSDLAAAVRRDPDLVSKHLRVLRAVGVVTVQRATGTDGRRQMYALPAAFVMDPPCVDFGFCLLRFSPSGVQPQAIDPAALANGI